MHENEFCYVKTATQMNDKSPKNRFIEDTGRKNTRSPQF